MYIVIGYLVKALVLLYPNFLLPLPDCTTFFGITLSLVFFVPLSVHLR
ncbi:uncharacterized protein VTP21DRAFT_6773 [Calcarisporiella thermophila]